MIKRWKILLVRASVILLILLLSLLGFYLVLIFPPPLPNHCIDLGIMDERTKSANWLINITYSNITQNEIWSSMRSIRFASLKNGVWETNVIGHPDEEVCVAAYESGKFESYVEVPSNGTAVQVGMFYSSPTWRSWLAGQIPDSFWTEQGVHYLVGLDYSKRSKEEWSPIIALANK